MIRALLFCVCLSVLASAGAAETRASSLRLSSPAFAAGAAMPRRFSCQGVGTSPPLAWSGVPAEARSLALIVEDPDAPSGLWIHWIVYNLPADSTGLKADVDAQGLPGQAAIGRNSYHDHAYGGVCPPSGQHRYIFRLYALDARLPKKSYDRKALLNTMRGHIVSQTRFAATYRKQ